MNTRCKVCTRDPSRVNNAVSECSFIECPHRGKAWSDRPTRAQYFKGLWPKNIDADPVPLDGRRPPDALTHN